MVFTVLKFDGVGKSSLKKFFGSIFFTWTLELMGRLSMVDYFASFS